MHHAQTDHGATLKAAIVGIAGTELTEEESLLLQAFPPAGIILFGRNIAGAMQLHRLIGDLREVLGPETRLLVDQEGGRVARLRPPDWSVQPAAGMIGAMHAQDPAAAARLAWLTGAIMGVECREAGFDVVCAPVLDLRWPGATDAIGDRSFGHEPWVVANLAQTVADGLLSAGIEPVGKHAPGHGQATVDSHESLPRIEADRPLAGDVDVFRRCATLPWMMTAHIVYAGWDAERPATLSPFVIENVIRGEIGFEGVLVSDDLAMAALSGDPGAIARAAIEAGCDLALHCSGKLEETEAVLRATPPLSVAALTRLARAAGLASRSQLQLDRASLLVDQAALLQELVGG